MRRIAILTAAVLLSGCAIGPRNTDQTEATATSSRLTAPPTTTERTTTAPTTTSNPFNNRGNRLKALGEEGGIADANGNAIVTFAVDSIGPVECTEDFADRYPPENGVLIGVQMRLSTGPDLSTLDNYFTISPFEFQYVGPDNITVTELATTPTYACLADNAQFPTGTPLNPGSQYVGLIVLDVPSAHGTLIFDPSYMDHGWEWTF